MEESDFRDFLTRVFTQRLEGVHVKDIMATESKNYENLDTNQKQLLNFYEFMVENYSLFLKEAFEGIVGAEKMVYAMGNAWIDGLQFGERSDFVKVDIAMRRDDFKTLVDVLKKLEIGHILDIKEKPDGTIH